MGAAYVVDAFLAERDDDCDSHNICPSYSPAVPIATEGAFIG